MKKICIIGNTIESKLLALMFTKFFQDIEVKIFTNNVDFDNLNTGMGERHFAELQRYRKFVVPARAAALDRRPIEFDDRFVIHFARENDGNENASMFHFNSQYSASSSPSSGVRTRSPAAPLDRVINCCIPLVLKRSGSLLSGAPIKPNEIM